MCKDLAQHGLIQTLNRTRMPHTAVNRTAPWLNRKSFRKAVGGPKASFKRLMFNFLFTTVSQLGLVTAGRRSGWERFGGNRPAQRNA